MRVQAFYPAMGFQQQLPPLILRGEYPGNLMHSCDGSSVMCSTRHAASPQSLAAAALRAINPNRMLQHLVNVAALARCCSSCSLAGLMTSSIASFGNRGNSWYAWSMN
ncbi:hypothetical protein [Sinorhizobium meliloti]|uniref:hypothetical protein n=1 Tax=Rhizobium meliloti TaxID=382 RepID=UPI0020905B75|nr:hypothetical protein [Sinorhizobium meliloti]MCO5966166.1 hypothetical protein [Sinorhizobium meliloti]